MGFSTLRLRQNGRNFTDDIFKHIFLVSIEILLKIFPNGPSGNIVSDNGLEPKKRQAII